MYTTSQCSGATSTGMVGAIKQPAWMLKQKYIETSYWLLPAARQEAVHEFLNQEKHTFKTVMTVGNGIISMLNKKWHQNIHNCTKPALSKKNLFQMWQMWARYEAGQAP